MGTAIKTVAAQNYEVLANVTQNNISIVWKCQRKSRIGEQPARREAAVAAAAAVGRTRGFKDLRVANPNEKQCKEIHQAGAGAFKMTFRVIDPVQVTV